MREPKHTLEPLFGRLLSPFEQFLRSHAAGGVVLVSATVVALGLATALGGEVVHHFWEQPLTLAAGTRFELNLTFHHWVNDGLMALFFLLVGLELKRELLVGELSTPAEALFPALAAVGGMVVPALVYALFNQGTPTAKGWGVPMATDIAFAIGILALIASRVPRSLVVFLTALAIVDDLGAVLIIALFYSSALNLSALGAVGGLFALLLLLNAGGIRHLAPYGLVGLALWYAMLLSGVHATIAGILIAIAVPARPSLTPGQFVARVDELSSSLREACAASPPPDNRIASIAGTLEESAAAVQSPLQRLEHRMGPWVTFLIVPLFALANAGIDVRAIDWAHALGARLTLGVMLGLALGKVVGISAFSWLAVRLRLARRPAGVTWRHLVGAAWLAGIGFTMSLFIAQLAFSDARAVEEAKLGILLGSLLSAAVGLVWLTWRVKPAAP